MREVSTAAAASLEEFRARLPLVEIVGRWVKLARRGREWVGLCPFHKEKTPSFTVVPDKGFYHCFGCGAHGDAIAFVMAIERLDFREALERLEQLTGIAAPRSGAGRTNRLDRALLDANAAAALWFQARLGEPGAARARAYLEGRGLDAATIRAFGLGWAPADRTALGAALRAQGFAEEILVRAGLLRVPEGGGPPYAFFRERVIFPIADARGRILGFGGRTLEEGQPKYLNTPDTELFHKGRLLYGLDRAAVGARTRGVLVVVEGYMDVIALARADLPAVAPLGTAMGEEQLEACWRLVERPIVCLDGDAAGLRAAERLAERAAPLLRPDRALAFVLLPEGEDPDSLVRGRGPRAFADLLARAEPLADFLWRIWRAGPFARLDSPEVRARLRHKLRAFVKSVADPDVRASLAEEFGRRLDAELARLRAPRTRREGAGAPGERRVAASQLAAALAERERWREAPLLAPILEDPAILGERGSFATVDEELAEFVFEEPGLERIRQEILHLWSRGDRLDAEALANHLAACGLAEPLARVRSAGGTRERTEAGEHALSPLERWRAAAGRLRRRLLRERELEGLRAAVAPASREPERPLDGLDRLLNAQDAQDEDGFDRFAPERGQG